MTAPPSATDCSAEPGITELSVQLGESEYGARIFVPTTAQRNDLIPTVVVFHAGGMTGSFLAEIDGFEALAESEGFVVVHPSADPAWPFWAIEDGDHPQGEDVTFAERIIDTMIQDWCADPSRIYATGLSIGGTFSARLACEIPERLAGVGAVAQIAVSPELCDPALPMPLVQINGTADPVIPFDGNGESIATGPESWRWMVETDVPEAFAAGAARRGCETDPTVSTIGDDVVAYRYSDCDGDVEMLRYEVTGGGHAWPGGAPAPSAMGYTTADISAASVLWKFLRSYSR